VILRPADLFDQFRPGYVPCLIAGDIKYRNGMLELNVMFRTSDALTVAYADIFYMRKLQMDLIEMIKQRTDQKELIKITPGVLNMFFARS